MWSLFSPTSAEKVSGWVAAFWVLASVLSDNSTSPIYLALASVASEPVWVIAFAFLATLQLIGSTWKITRARTVGCFLAMCLWLFLGTKVGFASNFTAPGWIIFVIFAWSQIATLSCLAEGERRR